MGFIVFLDYLEYIQIILPAIFVSNIAGITLAVAGINGVHKIAERTYAYRNQIKEKEIEYKNDDSKIYIPFRILESTVVITLIFLISEIILITPFIKIYIDGMSLDIIHTTTYSSYIFLFGITLIFVLYLHLLIKGRKIEEIYDEESDEIKKLLEKKSRLDKSS